MKSFKVTDNLYLNHCAVAQGSKKAPAIPTNHIIVLDCSGSMSGELPKIKEQLKKKLPKLIGEDDTISIIWFSGKSQFGTLLEAETVATLGALQGVYKTIDRWLKPIGLTGFKEPLGEASKVIERIAGGRPNTAFNLFFMSDGCDNQWPQRDILVAVERIAKSVSSATYVEYGYYADRPLLTQMAEKSGGQLIFAEHFDNYQPAFEGALTKKLTGVPKKDIPVSEAIGGFAFSMSEGSLVTYSTVGGFVRVPEDVGSIWYMSHTQTGELVSIPRVDFPSAAESIPSAIYAAVSLFSARMKPDSVLPLLRWLGDVKFIEDFSSCFGKQKYSDFMESTKAAAFNSDLRYTKGFDRTKVPADDAYTILDLLQLLASDSQNLVLLDHPDFSYSRIGRGRVDANSTLTEEEQAKVQDLATKIAAERNLDGVKELQKELAAIIDSKTSPVKFTLDSSKGYPISSLVYNEDRPNISFQVRKEGTVELNDSLPGFLKVQLHARPKCIPAIFQTFMYRNYAVIKDGLTNIEKLPVRVTQEVADKLAKVLLEAALPSKVRAGDGYVEGVINLRALPAINRKMVREVSAKDLFLKQYELENARAAQKVFKFYRDDRFPKKESATFKALYGNEAAEWLKAQGITDYSGFNPKTVQEQSTDFYLGKELVVSIGGLSSLPKVVDARIKIASGKPLSLNVALMAPYIREVEDKISWLQGEECNRLQAGILSEPWADSFKEWIEQKLQEATSQARKLIREIAQIKYSVIIGQTWFTEFSSLDENQMVLDLGEHKDVTCKVDMREVQIKI